jgi:copper chaperone
MAYYLCKMAAYTFYTTLKCGGCEATVKPFIEAVPGLESWKVDLTDPKKPLTAKGEHLEKAAVKAAIEQAGFKAESAD